MDKLKAFESFVSVATRGSLTAAAKAEGVAPAIMGRRLDALEEHLGVKLLVRTTRRISLTHEGSAFLEDCQRLLSDVANAEASVSEGGVKATGHLRITAPAGFGRRCQGLFEDDECHREECDYRFRAKICPACGAENDIAARRCQRC